MNEHDAEQAIASVYGLVDEWRVRLQDACIPAPGSDLYSDDQVDGLLTYSPSQLAYAALGSARDHLGAFHKHVEHRHLHPFADQTLVRTAISSAANAVCLLAPETRERRVERARCLAEETLRHHIGYLRTAACFTNITEDQRAHNAEILAAAIELQDRVAAYRAADGQKATFKQTATIEDAVAHTFADENQSTLWPSARAEWQRSSGAAHGLLWSILGVSSTRKVSDTDSDGVATFAAGGCLETMVEAHHLAFLLAQHAWRLLDRRLQVTR